MQFRIGYGNDCHRLRSGRRLVLGGITVPHSRGLLGHSDADIVLHALTDAVLGAAGLGDIGELFPDSDPQFRDADSAELFAIAWQRVREEGWRLGNLDCTISAERPKLKAYKPAIRENIARLLGATEDRVNIKAKTGELVGPVGRQEAMTADVVVLLERETTDE